MPDIAQPVVLVICDGWGERTETYGNAIAEAHTPHVDALKKRWPSTQVVASGPAVGLPEGQIGNSEVGHLTIGGGRVIPQALGRQHHEVSSGEIYQNEVLVQAIELARTRGTSVHILGLISPGGVHSHQNGALAVAQLAGDLGLDRVHVHAFTDGRDVEPRSALAHIEEFEKELAGIGTGRIASISGRYYAMDRDKRWERIEQAYEMLVGEAHPPLHPSATGYIKERYDQDETDEFLKPVAIAGSPEDRTRIEDGDVVVFINFRPDRARQLSYALVREDFDGFERSRVIKDLHFVSFASYDDNLSVPIVFDDKKLKNTLAEVISNHGATQFHLAETEKYAHVTYYLNGGHEEPFPGESRSMIPSLKVATYDLEPHMSATGITEAAIESLSKGYAFIVINYANADMVGHTGIQSATVQAIEHLDECLGKISQTALDAGYAFIMTADHGNAELNTNTEGKPLTAHTTNPVPVIICGTTTQNLRNGELRDISPTVLSILGLPKPPEMTGTSLLKSEPTEL